VIDTPPPSDPKKTPANRDLRALRRQVKRLRTFSGSKLDAAICDIIDQKGFALAVLIKGMHLLPGTVQIRIARKIEDFLFFHPNQGRRVLKRLAEAIPGVDLRCRPHLVSALADVTARSGETPPPIEDLKETAREVLASATDLARKGKAVEMLAQGDDVGAIPLILRNLVQAVDQIDQFANYQFSETCLFALKKLGGEGFIRVLINPESTAAQQQFRLEWRDRPEQINTAVLSAIRTLSEDFPRVLLKVVELSEFSVPFAAMVQEGLAHPDKWVRQSAAACAKKLSDEGSLEHLQRMLNDSSLEVRLMAVSSLGGYPPDMTGEILTRLGCNEGETLEIRMNALYALFNQKNVTALGTLIQCSNRTISTHAQGTAALLMAREDGLDALLKSFAVLPLDALPPLTHYVGELARIEDLPVLIRGLNSLAEGKRRIPLLEFLTAFLKKQAGPTLDKAMAALADPERRALHILIEAAKQAPEEQPGPTSELH
jgi:HEAT repeat protein